MSPAAPAAINAGAHVPNEDDADATEDELFEQLAARLLQHRS
jgi:hypothetical protein